MYPFRSAFRAFAGSSEGTSFAIAVINPNPNEARQTSPRIRRRSVKRSLRIRRARLRRRLVASSQPHEQESVGARSGATRLHAAERSDAQRRAEPAAKFVGPGRPDTARCKERSDAQRRAEPAAKFVGPGRPDTARCRERSDAQQQVGFQSMVPCANCGSENRPDARFCGECGAPLASLCAGCGAANEPGRKFCYQCGAALEGPVTAAGGVGFARRARRGAPPGLGAVCRSCRIHDAVGIA